MKAMTNTLYIVVAAVVILVTAVVVLAIFFPAIGVLPGIFEASTICQIEYTTSCATFDQKPPTWNIQNKDVKQGETTRKMSCEQILHDNNINCVCDNKVLRCTDTGSALPIDADRPGDPRSPR